MVGGASFLAGGFLAFMAAVMSTTAIERFGGRLGGIIASLPTTIVPAAAFIWLADPRREALQQAFGIFPMTMLVNVAYLWLWRVVPMAVPRHLGFRCRLFSVCLISITE